MANRWVNSGNIDRFCFGETPESLQLVTAAMKFKKNKQTKKNKQKKKHLLLGRKAMTNLDSIVKSRDITLLKNVCLVKAMVLPVVMYRCDSWTLKKAEH